MRLTLSIRKTLEDNASQYFEQAKKSKRKLEGARLAMQRVAAAKPVKQRAVRRKKEWYEQYRWTMSADGTLVIGGKDATSNEALIKKRTETIDTVLHTDLAGSPFVIIKGAASEGALEAGAMLAACYSKAWKQGLSTVEVFWVKPEQVSKTPNTGEYVGKGSFIIRGEKHYLKPELRLCLGLVDNTPIVATAALFKAKGAGFVELRPGKETTIAVAKKLAKRLGATVDEWARLLPAGGCVITSTTHKNTVEDKITHG